MRKIILVFSVIFIFIMLMPFSKVQSQIIINVTNVDSVLCWGDSTGSITVSASGGTPPYTYVWNTTPPQTVATALNLPAGIYTVTVNDNGGNSATTSAMVNEPPALQISVTNTPVSCFGGNNGTVTATVIGGTPTYTYAWCNGNSSNITSGLPAGSCSVTVTDANGCTAVETTVITQPTIVTVAITNIDSATCFGQCNGLLSVTASGGTPGYTYLWNNGQNNSVASGLCAGMYTVTATDNNGCTNSASYTVNQPLQLITTIDNHFDSLLCHADSNGYITINVQGGTFPWTFEWSTVPTQYTMTANLLGAGTYTVTVTDGNGCTATLSATIYEPPQLSVQVDSISEECLYACDGQATSAVTGGTLPWTYTWYNSNGQISSSGLTLTGLCPDYYYLVVTDANGCTASDTTIVTAPGNISIASFTASAVTGAIPLDVNFTYTGTLSYLNNYSWDFGDGASSTLENPTHTYIASDTFNVNLILENGICSDTFSIMINAGSTDCFAQFGIYPDSAVLHHYYIVNLTSGVSPISYLWNWGDGTYDTAAYPSHTYAAAGLYNICLTISDFTGCSSSYCYDATIQKTLNTIFSVDVISSQAGIPEPVINNDLTIFPNPVNDDLTIESSSQINGIEIADISGRILMRTSSKTIDCSNLAKGVYLIKITTDNNFYFTKFIKG